MEIQVINGSYAAVKIKSEKIHACTEVEPTTSAIPVRNALLTEITSQLNKNELWQILSSENTIKNILWWTGFGFDWKAFTLRKLIKCQN